MRQNIMQDASPICTTEHVERSRKFHVSQMTNVHRYHISGTDILHRGDKMRTLRYSNLQILPSFTLRD